ncbi:ABC transporter ATP-binding protein [Aneurinibacillus aneurinilyticus]|uniref:ABC transporter ATP-binding protein n=1 Tax=Aneurinibacillus aneurinilyticus TaxID=1391 RepID=UPI00366EE9E6
MLIRKMTNELFHLLSFMKNKKKMYMISLLGDSLVHASLAICIPFVFKDLTDFANSKDSALLTRAIIVVSGTFIFLSILSPLFSYLYHRCVKEVMNSIRLTVYKHMGQLSADYYERHHTGDTISRLSNDVHIIEQAYTEHLKTLLTILVVLLGSLVGMFLLDWRFSFVLVLLSTVTLFINIRFAKSVRSISDQMQRQTGTLTERLTDFISGLPVIKMFNLHNVVTKRYIEMNKDITISAIKQGHKNALLDATNFFINFLSFGGMLVAGIIMVSQNVIELGSLIAIVQQQMFVTLAFLHLGQTITVLQSSLAGAARVVEFLDEPVEPERYDLRREVSCETNSMIEMNEIVFEYEESCRVLNGFSLTVEQGKVAALVGASGSGKSTVIKLLLGFYPFQSGNIYLDGKPMEQYKLTEIRDIISYVPQEAYLFEGTIEENIKYGRLDASEEEIIVATKAAYAHDFIMKLPAGYQTKVGERGTMLSGGQRQRIAIARALLKNAPILLLDEATSALDSESEYWVQQALHTLMKDRTTLVIAHRLSTIEDADMIYVVEQGKVVEYGNHEALMLQNGLYANLYEMQTKVRERQNIV